MMRHSRPLFRAALVAVLALPAAAARADPITVRSAAVPLNSQDPAQRSVGRLRYQGGVHLTSDDQRFGGWSSLRLSPDGTRVTAISDEGVWMTARLLHDKAGFLTGLDEAEVGALLGLDGKALEGKDSRDSESCALLPDGSFIVGFEREHRLWRYPGHDGKPDGIPTPVKSPPGLAEAPFNGGIESQGGSGPFGRAIGNATPRARTNRKKQRTPIPASKRRPPYAGKLELCVDAVRGRRRAHGRLGHLFIPSWQAQGPGSCPGNAQHFRCES